MLNLRTIVAGLLFITLPVILFAQETEVLQLKDQPNYSEQNSWLRGHDLVQEVCYNRPGIIDEEYCMILAFGFPGKLKLNQPIDVQDTSAVRLLFDIRSVWNWEKENITASGHITLLNATRTTIKARLTIIIHDNRKNRDYLYSGERVFIKSRKKKQFEWGYQ